MASPLRSWSLESKAQGITGTERMREAIADGRAANGFAGSLVRHGFRGGPSVIMSPAVHALAEAGAYWLMDLVVSHDPRRLLDTFDGRAFLTIEVGDDGSALVRLHDGDDGRRGKEVRQAVVWTDFPVGKLTLNILWLYPGGTVASREPAIMFPSEE